jgi:hypothetical protein
MSSYLTEFNCYKKLKISCEHFVLYDSLANSFEYAERIYALISSNRFCFGEAVCLLLARNRMFTYCLEFLWVFRHVGRTVACDTAGKSQPLRSVSCLYVWLSRRRHDHGNANVFKCAERNSFFMWLSFTRPFCVIVFSPSYGLLTVTRALTLLPVTLKWVWPTNGNVHGCFYPSKNRETSGLPG